MNRVIKFAILSVLIAITLAACAPVGRPVEVSNPATAQPQLVERPAQVQSVSIEVIDGVPVQVNAIVKGNLSESCATLSPAEVSYADNSFQIALSAVSPADRGCAQMTTPFETVVPLDIRDKPAGTYTVVANGVSAVFVLRLRAPEPGTATPATAPTATAVPATSACTNTAAFVSDVTIPDNTVLGPDTAFTKTWRLKNTGSCTWDSSYLVTYISGTTMTQQPGYWIVPQGQTVAPGDAVNISVGMSSPTQNGTYGSYWGLKKDGRLLPVQGGANGNSFFVKIRVDDGTAADNNRVTDASIAIELEQGSGPVCTADATYLVHALITADGATTASYEIESTAGQIPAGNFTVGYTTPLYPVDFGNVEFGQAGTKTINLRFVGPYPYPNDITVMIRVNGGDWHSAKLPCQG